MKVVELKIKFMLYDLKIYQKTYDLLSWIKPTVQKFAKVHKYSLGIQLENEVLELLKKIIVANLKRENKKEFIEECFVHYEIIKVLIRLSKEYKLLSMKQYEFVARELEDIGRLLGGWYKRFS